MKAMRYMIPDLFRSCSRLMPTAIAPSSHKRVMIAVTSVNAGAVDPPVLAIETVNVIKGATITIPMR